MQIKLKLNGKPFDLHPPTPTVLKAAAFLDKAAPDDLFTTDELAAKIGVHIQTVKNTQKELARYTYGGGNGSQRYWGNPKAIAELRRQDRRKKAQPRSIRL